MEVTNVWEMNGDERRRLIVSALRDRYERAMEELTESMKQYNIIREEYEVIIHGASNMFTYIYIYTFRRRDIT